MSLNVPITPDGTSRSGRRQLSVDDVLKTICSAGHYTVDIPINDFGKIVFLSPERGVIQTVDGEMCSFAIVDLRMNGVTDLTTVLRVGCVLKFFIIRQLDNTFIATNIGPVCGPASELIFYRRKEVFVVAPEYHYLLEKECIAFLRLFVIFLEHGTFSLSMSRILKELAKFNDHFLNEYLGSSDAKRRKFIECRTHWFQIGWNDVVKLQRPDVYDAIFILVSFVLRNGGVTTIENTFQLFQSDYMPQSFRQRTGSDLNSFVGFLNSHTWLFAVFPCHKYVSASRNLPYINYEAFTKGIKVLEKASGQHQCPMTSSFPVELSMTSLNSKVFSNGLEQTGPDQKSQLSKNGSPKIRFMENTTNNVTRLESANSISKRREVIMHPQHWYPVKNAPRSKQNSKQSLKMTSNKMLDLKGFSMNDPPKSRFAIANQNSEGRASPVQPKNTNPDVYRVRSSISSIGNSEDFRSFDSCSTSEVNDVLPGLSSPTRQGK